MEKDKKNIFKILAVQIQSVIADKKANFENVAKIIEDKIESDVDIIVLPEVWTVGWKCDEFIESAEDLDNSETISFLSGIAKKYSVNIIGGSFITKKNGNYFNTCPVINRCGQLIATYDKMHLFSYYGCDEGTYVKNGSNPLMVELDGLKIGISICYDIRFAEIYRAYAKKTADLMINMAAWPMGRAIHWEALAKARAVENQTYFVALTQCGEIANGDYNLGYSRIINYNGEVLAELIKTQGAFCATINLDEMYDFRKKCPVINDIQEVYDVKIV